MDIDDELSKSIRGPDIENPQIVNSMGIRMGSNCAALHVIFGD